MKTIFKSSYFLGLSLGICISILFAITYVSLDNTHIDKAQLMSENVQLRKDITDKDIKIDILIKEKEELDREYKKIKDSASSQNSTQDINIEKNENVILDIRADMSSSQIADLLVENNIYKHKNDILLIIEILNFDRYKYSELLEEKGYISSSYELNKALKQIEQRQSGVAETLHSNNLVKDKNAFMKLLYLFDINNSIKYGQKEFRKDSSIREICDVLMK